MKNKSTRGMLGETIASLGIGLFVVLSLAWWGFLAWMIYLLVHWLLTK